MKSKSASSCSKIDILINKFPDVLIDALNHLIKYFLPSNVATTGTLFRLYVLSMSIAGFSPARNAENVNKTEAI